MRRIKPVSKFERAIAVMLLVHLSQSDHAYELMESDRSLPK